MTTSHEQENVNKECEQKMLTKNDALFSWVANC